MRGVSSPIVKEDKVKNTALSHTLLTYARWLGVGGWGEVSGWGRGRRAMPIGFPAAPPPRRERDGRGLDAVTVSAE